ncbi:RNase E specificity factor CsrD [Rouxiella silvae]|uniref:RNase E specificity factor CsrD n=1 Tax=Rouxiella silvae TaxID=1646373 RepID=A0AA40X680_9GAMM|nr:RNase E specificity factor CsrD [Rouxiella silvae]KQN49201.1 transcriptional regulator [Serratia sp. Leaf50]MBF6639426.1 RNase E specificity factor CsrD [Rouxiella silvae]ORJ21117.1 RNase E specificity factor CsrD [Rouxiella silvae]
MRFTTRLYAMITMLVALTVFLMLVGVTFSFVYLNKQNAEQHLRALSTSVDQSLLSNPPASLHSWLPLVMNQLDIRQVQIVATSGPVYSHNNSPQKDTDWDSHIPDLLTEHLPLLQHPDLSMKVVYLDPVSSYARSLRTTLYISFAILLIIIATLVSFRWLRLQTSGIERLEDRASRILRGQRDNLPLGDVREWPQRASAAIDKLLVDLGEAREQRSRVDTLIRAYAQQDAKTGLSNRLFFDNQLTTELEEEGAYGILMLIRLPDFDTLRDTHGQALVKDLLSSMVNLLSTFVMRYPSALLARYYHSDFAVLLPHSTLKEAEVMAAQLVKAVGVLPSSSIIDRDALLYIGISSYRYGQTLEEVMDSAEQATRNAAFQGSNGWLVYDSNVPEKGRGSVRWRTLLEDTLARGGPRLYQKPAMNKAGFLDHREVQRRIFDGTRELLAAEFIPLVTQFGLSQSFDRRMIGQIIPLLTQWPDETLAFHLTVDSLLQRSFVRWLRDILLQCEKSQRNRILIELAEADLCQHIDRLRPALRLLQGLGCRLAVSQAGLTVVSTSYLKSFPIERVKLHPGLVRDIDKRVENQLFVQSLLSACKGTQAKVYASGVRSIDEWLVLLENGIHGGQGDFFATPQVIDPVGKKYSHNHGV